jgi:hypothetical protein
MPSISKVVKKPDSFFSLQNKGLQNSPGNALQNKSLQMPGFSELFFSVKKPDILPLTWFLAEKPI